MVIEEPSNSDKPKTGKPAGKGKEKLSTKPKTAITIDSGDSDVTDDDISGSEDDDDILAAGSDEGYETDATILTDDTKADDAFSDGSAMMTPTREASEASQVNLPLRRSELPTVRRLSWSAR